MSGQSSPISLIAAFYRNETDAGEMLAQLMQMDKDEPSISLTLL